MNSVTKAVVAGGMALVGSGAFATGVPWSNSSDLVLLVENTTTSATYALDTGISLNTLMPAGSLVTGAVLNTTAIAQVNQTIAESSTLQAFISANPVAGDGWELLGGQYNGSSANTATATDSRLPGTGIVVYTSTITANQGTKNLGNMDTILNAYNTDLKAAGILNGLTTATEVTLATGNANWPTKYNVVAGDSLAALGTSETFYGFTGNSGTGVLQSYILGSAVLNTNGSLVLNAGSSAVPLPASVWLFGSGLLGLVGVSRRRKVAA